MPSSIIITKNQRYTWEKPWIDSITIEVEKDDYFSSIVDPLCHTYKVTIVGDRFLYKMVRFLVGLMVHYGTNPTNTSLQQVQNILSTGEWSSDIPRKCAPANGLILEKIEYGEDIKFNWMVRAFTCKEKRNDVFFFQQVHILIYEDIITTICN